MTKNIETELTFQEIFLYVVHQYFNGVLTISKEEMEQFFKEGFYYKYTPENNGLTIEVLLENDFENNEQF